ncbi:hypothetical protein FDP41_004047 [Naegleria fowleri]|uniref:AB hydrolase-1 domain-containing protein n=1 Tax=Naegleria fowleri TaxID=5763 RepID=A0A6A5BPM5_NAEFO|nr:uncharacterized protein FDP41_004047 [Naegleria fowleri]KAF0976752.1 hypothetical protein FDP41_004047 [Naegleria fowleri]
MLMKTSSLLFHLRPCCHLLRKASWLGATTTSFQTRKYSTKSSRLAPQSNTSTIIREGNPYLFFLNFVQNGKQIPKDEYMKQMMNNDCNNNSNSTSTNLQKRDIPTFFLHGLLGSGQNYVSIMNKYHNILAANGDCFLLDSRNHGRSSHTTTMSYDDLSDDIVSVMDELKLEKVNIVAHSMSGKAVMNLMLRETLNNNTTLLQRINKAVIVDVSPVDYTKDERWVIKQYIDAMRRINLLTLQTRTEAEHILAKAGGINPEARLFLLTNLIRIKENNGETAGAQWAWRCHLDVIEEYLPQLGSFPFKTRENPLGIYSLQAPIQYAGDNVLFLRGEKSMYVTDEYEIISKSFFPNATFETIKNASHWVHIDNPHEFATMISSFINVNHY